MAWLAPLERVLREMRVELVLGGLIFAMLTTGLLVTVQQATPRLLRFEHSLSDLRTALLSDRREDQHPRLAIVLVDEQTLHREPYSSPVDRGVLARLVAKLDSLGPKAIALDFAFYKPTEPAKDQALIAALRAARAPVIMAAGDQRAVLDDDERAYQSDFLRRVGRPAGHSGLNRDRDDIIRRKLGPARDSIFPVSFADRVAAVDDRYDPDPLGLIAWLRRPTNGADTFLAVKAETLIGEQAPSALDPQLKGRLVLVGGRFQDRDLHRVPLFASDNESNTEQIHGVFLHAQIIAQALDGRSVREVPMIPVVFMVSLIGFCLGWIFREQGVSWLVGGLATAAIIGTDMGLFWSIRRVLPYTPVTIAWLGAASSGYLLARLAGRLDRKQKEIR